MITGSDPTGRAPWVVPFVWVSSGVLLLAGSAWWTYRRIMDGGEPQFPLVASLLLIVWVGLALNVLLKRLRADPPTLTVTPDSVRPGDEITAIYRQRFRRPARLERADLRLVFTEEAEKGSGNSRTTHLERTVVASAGQTGREVGPGDELVLSLRARIPADAMHTFDAGHHELSWRVEAEVAIGGWPDESDFEFLEVRAERPT